MKLVSTPYRWLPSTVWKNVAHWGWDIRTGLRNIPKFFSAVWGFRSWDWTGMVELLQISAREMRKAQEEGIHVGDARESRRLRMVEELCRRLLEDSYFTKAGYDPETWQDLPDHECRRIAEHSGYMEKQDARYLGSLLRFVQHWWT